MRRLMLMCVITLLGVLLLLGSAFAGDAWRVVRSVRLLTEPSSSEGQRIKTLHPPELVTEIGRRRSGDYIRVRDGEGDLGWVYAPYLTPDTAPSAGGGAPPSGPVSSPPPEGLSDASAFVIPDCPPEGNPSPRGTRFEILKALNRLKNRTTAPRADAVESMVLSAFLASGDDDRRWRTDQAVELVGYVEDVKSGGPETCNCKTDDARYYDTHIELGAGPNSPTLPMIVEVTPAWRGLMATAGKDWSTESLQSTIEHKWVRVRGWLFNDSEHRQNAENTNPDGDHLWRRTTWEIHPVTSLEVVPGPLP